MRVDAHHHLWRYEPREYEWIDERMQALRRDFLPAELMAQMASAGVGASVAVQARQTMEETSSLLAAAKACAGIRGVVGWAPIAEEGFPAMVDGMGADPLLVGLRHVVQSEPDGFLDRADFDRGIEAMLGSGLVYDLLIVARQLPEATRCVDRHPGQAFVLDHIAKPEIGGEGFAAWERGIRELARRENVACKLSGMVTEAPWEGWTAEMLFPYFATVLEAFGADRLMVGSDWPVLTVACGYRQWWETVEGWLEPLAAGERAAIEGGVAERVYGLELPATEEKTG